VGLLLLDLLIVVYCYLICFVCMHLIGSFVEIVLTLLNLHID